MELIAIELPEFGGAKSRDLDLAAGANLAGALSGLGVDRDPAILAMLNGEAVPRDQWPETPLSPGDTVSLFRPFKGG
ncbi:MAG: MoaD/ThiS family protein [Rhodospirillales bacterium]|nr:MoaD/ThiS family protein [Rhodospirillales bacterium]